MVSLFEDCKNSRKQGDIGLGFCIAYCSKLGTVSIPLTDSQDYDLLLDINSSSNILKIQVKTTSYKTKYGIYSVNLSVKGGNRSFNTIKKFNSSKVDFVFVLTKDGLEYMIPSCDIKSKNLLNLGKKYDKFIINGAIPSPQTVNLMPSICEEVGS